MSAIASPNPLSLPRNVFSNKYGDSEPRSNSICKRAPASTGLVRHETKSGFVIVIPVVTAVTPITATAAVTRPVVLDINAVAAVVTPKAADVAPAMDADVVTAVHAALVAIDCIAIVCAAVVTPFMTTVVDAEVLTAVALAVPVLTLAAAAAFAADVALAVLVVDAKVEEPEALADDAMLEAPLIAEDDDVDTEVAPEFKVPMGVFSAFEEVFSAFDEVFNALVESFRDLVDDWIASMTSTAASVS
mmetsp:Transcript_1406/g.3593  ORF Transcript_1406/g.3593 Transcript_1406/m.3593 type:complete len:246 (-) Transcript_1406:979-1716(-)